MSLETSVHWLSEKIVRFEIKVGVYEQFTKKYNSRLTNKSHQAATFYARLTSSW